MDESKFERLKEFIVGQIGVREDEVTPDSRLYEDLGVYGDDATELLIEYGKRFKVDVSKFMAADYFKGEGMDFFGGLRRLFIGGRKGHKHKVLTVNDLERGIYAGRLDEEVIAERSIKPNYQVAELGLRESNSMEPIPTPAEWLLLRIIDEQPGWGNDYKLERFMAKTDLFVAFYEVLRGLVKMGWLEIKDRKAQVREYFTTPEGKALLAEGYTTEYIRDYVMTIEPTGYVVGILEKIDARSSENPNA